MTRNEIFGQVEVQNVTGASAHMHGVEFDTKKFREGLGRTVEFIKRKAKK